MSKFSGWQVIYRSVSKMTTPRFCSLSRNQLQLPVNPTEPAGMLMMKTTRRGSSSATTLPDHSCWCPSLSGSIITLMNPCDAHRYWVHWNSSAKLDRNGNQCKPLRRELLFRRQSVLFLTVKEYTSFSMQTQSDIKVAMVSICKVQNDNPVYRTFIWHYAQNLMCYSLYKR